jgi:hypothetical protein
MLIAEPPEGWRGESDLIVAVVMKPIGSYIRCILYPRRKISSIVSSPETRCKSKLKTVIHLL